MAGFSVLEIVGIVAAVVLGVLALVVLAIWLFLKWRTSPADATAIVDIGPEDRELLALARHGAGRGHDIAAGLGGRGHDIGAGAGLGGRGHDIGAGHGGRGHEVAGRVPAGRGRGIWQLFNFDDPID